MDVNKYIKIPFKSHGRDFDGCDCYGLVRLFLKNELGKDLPDFWDYNNTSDLKRIAELISKNLPLIATIQKDQPEVGDLVLYKIHGYVSHIGVYVGKGMLLHMMIGTASSCTPIDRGILKGRLYGFFEVK